MKPKGPQIRLENLFTFIGGGTPARNNPSFYSGNIPWVTVKDLHGDIIDSSELQITPEAISSSATNLIPAGTVIFATRVGLGKVGILSVDAAINQDLKAAIPRRNDIVPDYFLYWMKSNADVIVNAGVGATVKGVTLEFIRSLSLPVPSIDEQKRIVRVISRVATQIELRKRQIEKLDLLAKSRFIEMFGDTASNSMQWPSSTMKEMSARLSDGPFGSNLKSEHYTESGVRIVRLQNIGVNEFIDKDKAFVSEQHYQTLKKYTCRAGDIVIGTLGEPNLRACLIPQHILVSINKADCVHYIPNESALNKVFVCYYLNMPSTLTLAAGMVHGQTRARISSGQIAKLPIICPPLALQNEFAAFIEQLDKSKFTIRKSLEQLETLYRALLQEYFG